MEYLHLANYQLSMVKLWRTEGCKMMQFYRFMHLLNLNYKYLGLISQFYNAIINWESRKPPHVHLISDILPLIASHCLGADVLAYGRGVYFEQPRNTILNDVPLDVCIHLEEMHIMQSKLDSHYSP